MSTYDSDMISWNLEAVDLNIALDNMVLMMEVVIAWVIDISHAATLIV
jgi:hypothetical protein